MSDMSQHGRKSRFSSKANKERRQGEAPECGDESNGSELGDGWNLLKGRHGHIGPDGESIVESSGERIVGGVDNHHGEECVQNRNENIVEWFGWWCVVVVGIVTTNVLIMEDACASCHHRQPDYREDISNGHFGLLSPRPSAC